MQLVCHCLARANKPSTCVGNPHIVIFVYFYLLLLLVGNKFVCMLLDLSLVVMHIIHHTLRTMHSLGLGVCEQVSVCLFSVLFVCLFKKKKENIVCLFLFLFVCLALHNQKNKK